MERRNFIKTAALTAASAKRVLGANNRLRIALIGSGGRGRNVARYVVSESTDVEYTVMCDVYRPQAEAAKEQFGGKAEIVQDFRKVLERNDIDAVHIGTPDHWHAIPAVMACEAGKHVYCEKPLGHNVHEQKAMVKAAKENPKAVFLTGTQHRSAPHLMEAEEIVKSGKLSDVHFVRVWNYVNLMPGGLAETPDEPEPEGLDWDMYLGPAPWVPFNRARFLKTYRGFFDYAGGWISDFGVHRFDTIHQIMGVDAPRTISASGGKFAVGGMSDQPDILQVTYEYPGFVMSYETINTNGFGAMGRLQTDLELYGARGAEDRPNGMAFYGSNGTMIVDRRGFEIIPEGERRPGFLGSGELERPELKRTFKNGPDPTPLHAKHFVSCIRDGEKPRCDAVVGHRSSNIAHFGNIAYKTGRKLYWDAGTEDFISDRDASRHLGRRARAPWDLITVEDEA